MNSGISETAATTVKGSFILLVGNTVSFFVNAVGAIIVARMLTPSEYGLFTITLILPSFFTLFTSFGTTQALTRFIARYNSEESFENIIGLIRAGYIFNFLTGTFLSFLLYAFSDNLATFILKRPELGSYLRIASLLVLFQAIYVTGLSIFTGHEKMTLRASVNIIQSVIKGTVSPLLVLFGYGVNGVVVGHTLSIIIAAIIGLILILNLNRKTQYKKIPFNIINNINLMIGFGFPIFIGNIIVGIASQFRGFLLTWFVSDEVIGNFGIASWFNILIGVITMSIGVTFLPAFSKVNVNQAPEKSRELFQGSIRYSSLFLIPLITLLMVSSKPVIYTIFGGKYPLAPSFLIFLLVPSLFCGLGSLSISSFLTSQEETRVAMVINSVGALLTIILSSVFMWLWDIEGMLISFILSGLVQNLLGLYIIKNRYGIGLNLSHTGRTVLSSLIAGVISLGVHWVLPLQMPFQDLIVSLVVFISTFLILAPILGAIEIKDINILDSMLFTIRVLYPIARRILDFEKWLLNIGERVQDTS
ncbi:MAG: oligosaccharide flippase family protein [Candidatus Hodarchaeales archaeon]